MREMEFLIFLTDTIFTVKEDEPLEKRSGHRPGTIRKSI